MAAPPKIFISATSADLRSARVTVRDALLATECHPVEQTTFGPGYRAVHRMLEAKIRGCQALIHLVGLRYGAEPDPASLADRDRFLCRRGQRRPLADLLDRALADYAAQQFAAAATNAEHAAQQAHERTRVDAAGSVRTVVFAVRSCGLVSWSDREWEVADDQVERIKPSESQRQ
jgi:hypothetical protein